jgi:hypothetical protein
MDQKYFDEIKARAQDAECGEIGAIADSQHDVKSLIAEVERLTIENLGLKDAAIRCDGYEKRYHAALTELDTKDQQIATLKKALEYACADRATTPSMWQDLQKKYMEIAHQAQEREGKK